MGQASKGPSRSPAAAPPPGLEQFFPASEPMPRVRIDPAAAAAGAPPADGRRRFGQPLQLRRRDVPSVLSTVERQSHNVESENEAKARAAIAEANLAATQEARAATAEERAAAREFRERKEAEARDALTLELDDITSKLHDPKAAKEIVDAATKSTTSTGVQIHVNRAKRMLTREDAEDRASATAAREQGRDLERTELRRVRMTLGQLNARRRSVQSEIQTILDGIPQWDRTEDMLGKNASYTKLLGKRHAIDERIDAFYDGSIPGEPGAGGTGAAAPPTGYEGAGKDAEAAKAQVLREFANLPAAQQTDEKMMDMLREVGLLPAKGK